MIFITLTALALVASAANGAPQRPQEQGAAGQFDYEYFYDDLPGPNFAQPAPQPVTATRPRTRTEAAPTRAPAPAPSIRTQQQGSRLAGGDVTTTTHIPILKDSRRTDPATGAFIYDYMGADGSGKYEVRFPNGTVIGNFTYINDAGERETRWYSAGERGTEIEGDSVISPAPPTLVDETTGKNYVDLSNYDLYRHLEVPYVHIAGPSDPDERGQLSRPGVQRPADDRRQQFQSRPAAPPQPALDFGDETRFVAQEPQVQAPQPSRVSRTRTRVSQPSPAPAPAPAPRQNFDASALDTRSPDHVLDSLIQQFQ